MKSYEYERRMNSKELRSYPTEISVSDFDLTAPYIYKVVTFTGLQRRATSNARVFLRLIGSRRVDAPKCLNAKYTNVTFKRGEMNIFLLSTHISLGDIKAVNFWHDESGLDPSWYIRHCIVYDIHHQKIFYFCCYSWLSTIRGIRATNRIFTRSQRIDQYSFGHLFISTFCWNLYNYHTIWSNFLYQSKSQCKHVSRMTLTFSTLLLLYLPIYRHSVLNNVQITMNNLGQILLEYIETSFYSAAFVSMLPIVLTMLLEWAYKRLPDQSSDIRMSQLKQHQQKESRVDQIRTLVNGIMKDDISRYKHQVDMCKYLHDHRLYHRRRPEWLDNKLSNHEEYLGMTLLNSIENECDIEKRIINQDGIDVFLEAKYKRQNKKNLNRNQNYFEVRKSISLKKRQVFTYVVISIVYLVQLSIVGLTINQLRIKSFISMHHFLIGLFAHFMAFVLLQFIQVVLVVLSALMNALLFKKSDAQMFSNFHNYPPINISQNKANSHIITTENELSLESRIKERILENNLVDAIRDILGYLLFLVLVCVLSYENMNTIKTFYHSRNVILNFFNSDNILDEIQKPQHLLYWTSSILDQRLFQEKYHCIFEQCKLSQIPNEPFFLIKDAHIKLTRTRKFLCTHVPYSKYDIGYRPYVCMANLNELTPNYFHNENATSRGWTNKYSSSNCTKLPWLSYKPKTTKTIYKSYNSPFEYIVVLSSKDVFKECSRRKSYDDLIRNEWVDSNVQMVRLEGVLYNPNTDVMSSFMIAVESKSTGQISKKCEIHNVISNSKKQVKNYWRKQITNICHYIYAASIIIYFLNEIYQCYKLTKDYGFRGLSAYLHSFANWLDISLILISIAYFSHYIFQVFLIKKNFIAIGSSSSIFNIRPLTFNQQMLLILSGCMLFLSIIKFLNLLKFNPKTFLLTETITASRRGFMVLSIVYVLNLTVFTLIGRALFSQERKFATMKDAFVTSYSSVTKGSDSLNLFRNNKLLTSTWLCTLWIISQVFIQNFLVSYVINKFAHIRRTHVASDEEKVLGRVLNKIALYFGAVDHRDFNSVND